MPDLLAIAKTGKTDTFRVLAFRGYMRLLNDNKPGAEELVKKLDEAMKFAPQADEKKLVIGSLGELKTASALPVLSTVLTDPALQADAGAAYLRVVDAIKGDKPTAIAVLKRFLELSKDEGQRANATKMLDALEPKQ
jgi:HEAT repeat protein